MLTGPMGTVVAMRIASRTMPTALSGLVMRKAALLEARKNVSWSLASWMKLASLSKYSRST